MSPSKVDRAVWRAMEIGRVESRDPTRIEDREFTADGVTRVEFLDAARDPKLPGLPERPRADLHALARAREQAHRERCGAAYLRLEEAAALVGVAPPTINRWARDGRISSIVVGGRKAYARAELEAIASEKRNAEQAAKKEK